ncbi:MAG: alpha/beta fold hydrolase [Myxococcaceae bacterium]
MLPVPPLPPWLERQLPFRRSMLEVRSRQMHLMEHGQPQGRPVLMLHGNPTWSFLWRKVAMQLTHESLRLVMPDLIGLGLSEKPGPGVHTLEFHGAQIAALVEQLDLQNLVLVVQDWGGPIGGVAAAALGKRVAGLIVLNTILGPPRVGFRPTPFHRFSQMPLVSTFAFRVLGFPQLSLGFAQGDRTSISGDVSRAYRWPLRNRLHNGAPLALARMVPDSQQHPSIAKLQECEAWVRSFKGPRALVWGTKDPVLGRTLKRAQTLLEVEPVVTPAGHFLQEEVPVEIAGAIRRVVAQLN